MDLERLARDVRRLMFERVMRQLVTRSDGGRSTRRMEFIEHVA